MAAETATTGGPALVKKRAPKANFSPLTVMVGLIKQALKPVYERRMRECYAAEDMEHPEKGYLVVAKETEKGELVVTVTIPKTDPNANRQYLAKS
jgi:hypothetical protein